MWLVADLFIHGLDAGTVGRSYMLSPYLSRTLYIAVRCIA